jgi:hypothetical protein
MDLRRPFFCGTDVLSMGFTDTSETIPPFICDVHRVRRDLGAFGQTDIQFAGRFMEMTFPIS